MISVILIMLQVIIFIFLAVFLRKMLTQNVTSATRHLEEMSEEYKKKQEEVKKKIEETKHVCQEEIAHAREEADKVKSDIIQAANEEKGKIVEQAHKEAKELIRQGEKARENLIIDIEEQIRKKAIEVAAGLAGDILTDRMRSHIHTSLIDDFIKEEFESLGNLGNINDTVPVIVTSAFALGVEKTAAIEEKIREKLGERCSIEHRVDVSLIAGIIVSIESFVIDASFNWKIKEKAKELAKEEGV